MGILSAIGKGLKYAGTAAKTVGKYAFGNGVETISRARKIAKAAEGGSIFSKNVVKAGWNALKKDVVKTAASKKSIWKCITGFGKSLVSKTKAGVRLAEITAKSAGKTAGFWAKLGGAFKGLGKCCKKLPVIGTLITIGFEIPDIYKAFTHKEGGLWEGIKQIGKSALKIAGGAAGAALGSVIGGPIGGAIGYMAGEWLTDKLLGGSFSDNHPDPEETDESEATEGAQVNPEEAQVTPEKQGKTETKETPEAKEAPETKETPETSGNTKDENDTTAGTKTETTPTDTTSSATSWATPNVGTFGYIYNQYNPANIASNPFLNSYMTGMNNNYSIFGMPNYNMPYPTYYGEDKDYTENYKFRYIG